MKAIVAALCLLSAAVSAQSRDSAKPPVGTGAIVGRVTTDDADSHPLHHVLVSLASGGLTAPLGAMSDDTGQFVFANLPAGTYTLTASRPGYVATFYGAKQPGKGPGVPIAVGDGQRVTGINLKLLHGSVISGVIRLANGRPVAGADVSLLKMQMINGQKVAQLDLQSAAAAAIGGNSTDDRGMYRLYGLAPGEYVVQARLYGLSSLGAGIGGIGGPTVDARSMTPADVQWAQQAAASPNAPLPPAPASGQNVVYAPVFYPGTTDVTAAGVIALGPNEERDGVDVSIVSVPTARVTGTVLDQDGRPLAGAQVSLKSTKNEVSDVASLVQMMFGSVARSGADGSFSFSSVTPGAYSIEVRASARRATPGEPAVPAQMAGGAAALLGLLGGGGGASQPTLWGSEEVNVNGTDVTGVTVALQMGMTVSGKIVFDGTIAPPKDLKTVRVMLMPAAIGASQADQIAAVTSSIVGTAADDGTFTVSGVTPNKYRVQVISPGMMINPNAPNASGWVLKSVMATGRDIVDVPLDVHPNESVTGVVATFTDRPTEISGTIFDQAGHPLSSFPLVVFSTDRAYWITGSRRIQQGRPASDGKYKIVGLPPGEYYVTAVTDLEPTDLYDPTFLEQLAPTAFKITLGDGEKKTQDLKLAGGS